MYISVETHRKVGLKKLYAEGCQQLTQYDFFSLHADGRDCKQISKPAARGNDNGLEFENAFMLADQRLFSFLETK
jgi:hypothetical protein